MESTNNEGGSSADANHEEHQHLQSEGNNIPEDSESQEESQILNENLQCRFYKKDFPDENDIVIVSSLKSFIPQIRKRSCFID
jgi:hypothetical protein